MSEKLYIFDTTLRDGEQSPGCSMNLEEKMEMARQLDRLGVDILEAGFPIASQGDFDAVSAISAEVRRPTIAALARALDGEGHLGVRIRGQQVGEVDDAPGRCAVHRQHQVARLESGLPGRASRLDRGDGQRRGANLDPRSKPE